MNNLPTGDKMENFIIAFDVDGTLISNINENITQERRVHGQAYPFDAANTQVVEFLILCSRIFKNVKVVAYCAGRPECHNCGQPLWDDYVKEPLDHSDYNYNHAACCDLVLSHFTYDDWEIGDDDKLRMHDYVLVVYPDAETGNKINIVCQIVEMCGVGLPALRALETGDRTSIMGTYITNCRLVRIKKPEEKQL